MFWFFLYVECLVVLVGKFLGGFFSIGVGFKVLRGFFVYVDEGRK